MIGPALAIAWKELLVIFRDRGALVVLFILPLAFATVLGGPSKLAQQTGESNAAGQPALELGIYIVNEDDGPYGSTVSTVLQATNVLKLAELKSRSAADQMVGDGKKAAAIVIPADFSEKIDRGEPTAVQLIGDPAQAQQVALVSGIVNQAIAEMEVMGEIRYGIHAVLEQAGLLTTADDALRTAAESQTLGVIWTQVQQMRQNPVIAVHSEDAAGKETESPASAMDWYIAAFTVMFVFFLLPTIGQAILQEKEQGTFRRLLASPIHRGAIIGGLVLAYTVVVFLQVVFMFGVGRLVFGVNLGSSPLGLLVVTIATALAATTFGLLIGAVAKSSEQANSLGMILGFTLMIVGGCIIAWFQFGGVIALISNLTPHAHALQAYTGLMVHQYSLTMILPHVAALLGFASVFFAVAIWRLRF